MINEKYSYKDFHFQDLTKAKFSEFEGEIYGSAFSQREPFTKCFPDKLAKAIFIDCNLNNCIIPEGNEVRGGTHKQIKEQADGEIWIVNELLQPVSPMKPYRFDAAGLSKDPAMIATQAAMRIPLSDKVGASTKLLPVTAIKEHQKNMAMKALLMDTARLETIVAADMEAAK